MPFTSEYQLSANYDTEDPERDPGLYIGRTGIAYTTAYTAASGPYPAFNGFAASTPFSSWDLINTNVLNIQGYGLAGALHFPWHDNASETICYYGSISQSQTTGTWEQTFDFTLDDYGWVPVLNGLGNTCCAWVAGVGFRAIFDPNVNPATFEQVIIKNTSTGYTVRSMTMSYFSPTSGNCALTFTYNTTDNSVNPASNNGSYTHDTDPLPTPDSAITSKVQLRVLQASATSSTTVISAATIRGTGTNPYTVDEIKLYRANGPTRTDITPVDSSARPYTVRFQRSIHTPDNNRFRVCVCGCNGTSDTEPTAVFLSSDGGDSWVQVGTIDETGGRYRGCFVSDNGIVWVWGGAGYLGVARWEDLMAGGVFDVRTGNLPSETIKLIIGG
jgi:hypothetical protein